MFLIILRRHRTMILVSLLFFYSGCVITLSFIRLDCDAFSKIESDNNPDALTKIEYAVLILSGPDNESKRDAIRSTWGKLSLNIFEDNGEKLYKWNQTRPGHWKEQEFIKTYFVVGTGEMSDIKLNKLKRENSRSNDMILLDSFNDSYKNLAVKMLHSLRWISVHLRGLKYLIKSDDDSFVRVDLIVRDLDAYGPHMNAPALSQYVSYKETTSPTKGLYWGYFNGRAKVFLDGKWEEKEWFLCDKYLPYALGGGYVISRSIVDYIGRNADFLSHYISEDVSMGVWTAALDGINRVHDIRFDTQWRPRGCSQHMLVKHKQSPSDMFQLYKTLVHSNGEQLCRIETTEAKSYMYKWDVLPSLCCR